MALSTAALPPSLGDREVLEGGHPVAPPVPPFVGDRLEVARASKLLRAEAFGHLACELRDVPLLSYLDEDSLHAERLQFGRSRSAAFRIPLDPRHVPTLCGLGPRSRWVERYGCSLPEYSEMFPERPRFTENRAATTKFQHVRSAPVSRARHVGRGCESHGRRPEPERRGSRVIRQLRPAGRREPALSRQ